jgi:hypothetical protein
MADAAAQSTTAHIGINGVGLMFECVAAEMGWITLAEAQQRITQSLTSLAGKRPGFQLPRNQDGWIPTFFNKETGAVGGKGGVYTTLDTGLNAAGVLFAKTYFESKDPGSSLTKGISKLAQEVWEAVRFENVLCNTEGKVDPNGTAIPFTYDDNQGCKALHLPADDGYYTFSELHYTVWLAYNRACAGQAAGKCSNKPIERMWTAWQGRREHPNDSYKSYPLLSYWPSYIVQLPFYASHAFNNDSEWSSLFKSHWQADWAYYNSSAYYAGDEGRYGLAAGPTDKWCSCKNSGYEADMLVTGAVDPTKGKQGCKLYSPYAIAGYMPAAPATIQTHLLQLLAAGDSVLPMKPMEPMEPTIGAGYEEGRGSYKGSDYILTRRSLIEPGWSQNEHLTMVDFSSELFGLSTIWLGTDFYAKYTNHWPAA